MHPVVIENPVINSPFEEPRRHFRFDDEGMTNEIVTARPVSQYFMPIAKPRKSGTTCPTSSPGLTTATAPRTR
jgi:type III restriction enzyme